MSIYKGSFKGPVLQVHNDLGLKIASSTIIGVRLENIIQKKLCILGYGQKNSVNLFRLTEVLVW